jgi:threonine dehydratase
MSALPTPDELVRAAEVVHAAMPPTPQYRWPLLCDRLGTEVWVKHENHTPVGAFKLRGGLVYFDDLARSGTRPKGVISATRGNHGQSVAFGAARLGLPVTIVVPHGNSIEKNAAMRALGAELIEHGEDFQASLEHARELADARGLLMVPSFHPLLIRGVASYAMELFGAVEGVDVAYVPIGLGSGICGMLSARVALGARAEIVGVVSAHATAYADSFATRTPVERPVTTELADGMACRTPVDEALELIWQGVDRVVTVTDDEVAAAMRLLYETTHSVSEGAGAAATAAAFAERDRLAGKRVAVVLSGGNVDREVFAGVLGVGEG